MRIKMTPVGLPCKASYRRAGRCDFGTHAVPIRPQTREGITGVGEPPRVGPFLPRVRPLGSCGDAPWFADFTLPRVVTAACRVIGGAAGIARCWHGQSGTGAADCAQHYVGPTTINLAGCSQILYRPIEDDTQGAADITPRGVRIVLIETGADSAIEQPACGADDI